MKKHILFGLILGICLTLISLEPLHSVTSNNSSLMKYNFHNQITLQLPKSTSTLENSMNESGQLLYSVYLDDQKQLIRGYVQIWNLNDLEMYLVDSKRISTFDFGSYLLKPIKIANFPGYLTEWTASFGDNYRISGREYWLRAIDSSLVLRISFFTDTPYFTKEQIEYIHTIVNSIYWTNTQQ